VNWLRERGVQAEGHFAFGYPIDEIANLATRRRRPRRRRPSLS
jgi:hypothetical protein